MNLHEEELQKKVESGLFNANDPDSMAYQRVFNALTKEPGINLPRNFSDKVIQRLLTKQEGRQTGDLIWFGIGIFVLLAGCVAATIYISAHVALKFDLGFLSDISGMKWFFVLAAMLVAIFNWLDKKLLSKHHHE
jgi:hypothetical protein